MILLDDLVQVFEMPKLDGCTAVGHQAARGRGVTAGGQKEVRRLNEFIDSGVQEFPLTTY